MKTIQKYLKAWPPEVTDEDRAAAKAASDRIDKVVAARNTTISIMLDKSTDTNHKLGLLLGLKEVLEEDIEDMDPGGELREFVDNSILAVKSGEYSIETPEGYSYRNNLNVKRLAEELAAEVVRTDEDPRAGRTGGSMSYGEGDDEDDETLKFKKSLAFDVQTKSYGLMDLRKSADGRLYLEGYASDDSWDRDGDRMHSSALRGMAETINRGGLNLFADHEHKLDSTLGVFTKAEVQGNKLWVQARLEDPENNPRVKSLLSKLDAGMRCGLSIGGDLDKHHFEDYNGRRSRVIDSVKLYEISAVMLPANANAVITGTKRF